MGAEILRNKYLDDFMKSVIGYITIDLQHNIESNLKKYGNQLHMI
jgi:hypothetical protein